MWYLMQEEKLLGSVKKLKINCGLVYAELINLTKNNSLILCIENEDYSVDLRKLLNFVRIFDEDSLKICLDVGHTYSRVKGDNLILFVILKGLDRYINSSFRISIYMPYEHYGSLSNFIRESCLSFITPIFTIIMER